MKKTNFKKLGFNTLKKAVTSETSPEISVNEEVK